MHGVLLVEEFSSDAGRYFFSSYLLMLGAASHLKGNSNNNFRGNQVPHCFHTEKCLCLLNIVPNVSHAEAKNNDKTHAGISLVTFIVPA